MKAIHVASPSEIDLAGVMIIAGSRMDPSGLSGLAHFVEHTIFKGTAHRRACHINGRMEAIGGELNAFTSKEETVIYTISPSGNLPRALQLVGELVAEPSFPEREIDIERAVIMDEIDSYLDSPPDAAFDDFEDELFTGSALGHNILGSRSSVDTIKSEDCRQFVERWYTPRRMVAFYSGAARPEAVFRLMERYCGSLQRPETSFTPESPEERKPFSLVRPVEGIHQANTVCGIRTGGFDDPDHWTMAVLCNILGGPGMNSLLNVELRERRGLVYSVDASLTHYTDCGLLAVSYGCDPDDATKCRNIVDRTLSHTLPSRLTPRSVAAAKRQYIGQMAVGADNRENTLFRAARSTYFYGQALSLSEAMQKIEAITAPDLLDLCSRLRPEAFSSLTLTTPL